MYIVVTNTSQEEKVERILYKERKRNIKYTYLKGGRRGEKGEVRERERGRR